MSPEKKFDMSDYVPVNERIEAFYKAHPKGTLQSEIVELSAGRVTIKAYAYRAPDDTLPGIGHSSLSIPGSTPYTKDSELENCETSAWGRAIAALGFEVKRGIATEEDVRNKAQRPKTAARTAEENKVLDEILALPGMTHDKMRRLADVVGVPKGERASLAQLLAILDFATDGNAVDGAPSPDAATVQPATSPPGGAAAPSQPTLEDVLAVTGGEEVKP